MFFGVVHTSGVQPMVRVPDLGQRVGLGPGPLLHSLGARICTVHVGNVPWDSEAGGRTKYSVIYPK